MTRFSNFVVLAIGLSLAACNGSSKEAETINIHHMMKDVVDPQADRFWAVGNAAFDEIGDMDPARITPSGWAQAEAEMRAMANSARQIAGAPQITVRLPQDSATEDLTPQQALRAQQLIAADRATFNQRALALAAYAEHGAAAAKARDIKQLSEISSGLDAVCEACHKKFWVPALEPGQP